MRKAFYVWRLNPIAETFCSNPFEFLYYTYNDCQHRETQWIAFQTAQDVDKNVYKLCKLFTIFFRSNNIIVVSDGGI